MRIGWSRSGTASLFHWSYPAHAHVALAEGRSNGRLGCEEFARGAVAAWLLVDRGKALSFIGNRRPVY